MCRGIAVAIGGTVSAIERPRCPCRPISVSPGIERFRRLAVGRPLTSVRRRGKRVVLELGPDRSIVIEPRMTGLVLRADPPSNEHLRFRIGLTGGPVPEILFWDRRGLGTIRLLSGDEFASEIDARLGIDALDIDPQVLRERLGGGERPIKVALLDQSRVAGIGNLYASEILFVAGIDPRQRCRRLTRPQWQRLAEATLRVLADAIAHEGSTLRDGTYRNALNDPGGYQNRHRVYDRAGRGCSRCGEATIRRIVQAQRSTFFCPHCQRRSGRHPSVA